ncbi:hypothetical protein ACQCSX_14315 [Pseudarthrobacter sp. P1]|uniref:hypothetical protein n=1 Tax=Pseudarthrobacter sp. P1 TaxID=3418418 RepID=UPI003CEF576F
MQKSIEVILPPAVAGSATTFCARAGVDETALFLAVLRLYAADSRIGDDFAHGSGPFADAVDELVLCMPRTVEEPPVFRSLPQTAAAITQDAVWAYTVSLYNRGLAEYPAPGPLDAVALSLLLEAGLVFLRRSDGYTRTVVQSLRAGASLIEDKEEAWRQLLPSMADFPPPVLKKYARSQYAEKLALDQSLLDGWLVRLTFVNNELAAKLAECSDVMALLERDSEFLHLQLAESKVGRARLTGRELKDFAADLDARTESMNQLRASIDALIKERTFRGGIIDEAYGITEGDSEEARA